MQTMFDVPSQENVRRVVITADCVRNGTAPQVVCGESKLPETA